MLAEQVEVVIGVNTHRDTHALAALAVRTGEVLRELQVSADPAGYRRALASAVGPAPNRRVWAIEGAGSFGAGLRRHLVGAGERVVAIDRPSRLIGRAGPKSDALDAVRVARAALCAPHPGVPRADGLREALRVLMVARAAAVGTRARSITQIKALVVSGPERLRAALGGLSRAGLLSACAALRPGAWREPAMSAHAAALRSLARQARLATAEAAAHQRRIAAILDAIAPALMAEPGIGPITGAQLVIGFSHPGRIRSEAAFARLAGAAPIPASSGQVVRHRLDRGGDRQLNRALHTILLIRRSRDPATRAYIARRTRQGRSEREAIRCLKRYLARHVYRLMQELPLSA